jgi:CHAT domain-containing protein/Tfp pilus assembly protein PilF
MIRRAARWATRVVSALLPVAVCVGAPAAAQEATVRLEAGSSVEREAGAGETHRYEVDLVAGQYLQVSVEQQGVDVAQTLAGPDGGVVLETDCPCGPIGADPLAYIAAVSGRHVLALESRDVAVPPRGRYVLRVEALREPTSDDRLRAQAVRAGAEALRVTNQDPRAELEHDRVALAAWESLGDRHMQLWTLQMIGFATAFGLDQAQAAEEPYRRALAIALERGDEWAEARVSDDLSQVVIRLGLLDETRALMERALALHRAARRPLLISRMLTVLGNLFSRMGEPQQALDHLYGALEINEQFGNTQEIARTRIEIGSTYLRLDDAELALVHYEQALPGLGDPRRRARCLTEMGVARLKLGDQDGARRAYEEALGIYRTLQNPISEADTLIGVADLDRDRGDLAAALKRATAALQTYSSRAYTLGIGFAQCRVGEIQRRLGDAPASTAAFEAVVRLGPAAGASALACAEQGLARLGAAAGSLEGAQRHAEAAMAHLETLRGVASPRARAAALASRQSVFSILIDVLMRAHERSPASGQDALAFEVSERARARSLLDLLGSGHVDVRQGVRPELLAEERSLRGRLNAAAASHAEAAARGQTARLEALGRDLDRLSAQLADTESRIRTASPHYAALTQARPLTLAEIRSRVLDPGTQLLQYALGEERSYAWVVSQDRLESVRLAPRAEIEAAALAVHQSLSSPAGAAAPAGPGSAQARLSGLVLEPVAKALGAKRLLVVAPGALQYVPFGALPLPGGAPLVSRFELVSAPSASVVATLRDESTGRARARRAAVVFADPVFERSDPRLALAAGTSQPPARAAHGDLDAQEPAERALRDVRGGLGRLPFSRGEADAIASLAGGASRAVTGFEANRAAATSPDLADYRIVHFATHGVLNTRRPELSGVVLSLFDAAGRRQDGFLRLHDVYNLRLGADLVVLSGCQTGLGQDLGGEGLIGLTRGFLYAGARGVVASLWQVDDVSTAELMKRFYRAMLKQGQPPAAALRTAQLELARDPRWTAPFHWAGFVLQGDWR